MLAKPELRWEHEKYKRLTLVSCTAIIFLGEMVNELANKLRTLYFIHDALKKCYHLVGTNCDKGLTYLQKYKEPPNTDTGMCQLL